MPALLNSALGHAALFSPAPQDARRRPVVVLDLDGTLVDTAPDLAASLDHCLAAVGLPPVPVEVVRPHAGQGVKVMLQKAYANAGRALPSDELDEQFARFLVYYEDNIAERSTFFPGALAALDRLRAAGFALAICSNKLEHLARRLLDELGAAGRFAAICGADTFAGRKPDPVHLSGTIERAGGGPGLMVGDAAADVDAARALGVPCVLVDFGCPPGPETSARADRIIHSFDELGVELALSLLANTALAR